MNDINQLNNIYYFTINVLQITTFVLNDKKPRFFSTDLDTTWNIECIGVPLATTIDMLVENV